MPFSLEKRWGVAPPDLPFPPHSNKAWSWDLRSFQHHFFVDSARNEFRSSTQPRNAFGFPLDTIELQCLFTESTTVVFQETFYSPNIPVKNERFFLGYGSLHVDSPWAGELGKYRENTNKQQTLFIVIKCLESIVTSIYLTVKADVWYAHFWSFGLHDYVRTT